MSSVSNASSVQAFPPEPSLTAGIFSFVIPGLGQIYQGRIGKGILFMVSLLGMFILGQAMGGWQNVYLPRTERGLVNGFVTRWHYAGQFWIGAAAWPALWQYYDMPVPALESQPFWHNFQRMPDETELNRFLVTTDKTPDLGWVYTVIAGMLNILVIYDAYAGPALPSLSHPSRRDPAAASAAMTQERVA